MQRWQPAPVSAAEAWAGTAPRCPFPPDHGAAAPVAAGPAGRWGPAGQNAHMNAARPPDGGLPFGEWSSGRQAGASAAVVQVPRDTWSGPAGPGSYQHPEASSGDDGGGDDGGGCAGGGHPWCGGVAVATVGIGYASESAAAGGSGGGYDGYAWGGRADGSGGGGGGVRVDGGGEGGCGYPGGSLGSGMFGGGWQGLGDSEVEGGAWESAGPDCGGVAGHRPIGDDCGYGPSYGGGAPRQWRRPFPMPERPRLEWETSAGPGDFSPFSESMPARP